jgi:hypothetical protein
MSVSHFSKVVRFTVPNSWTISIAKDQAHFTESY